MVFVYTLYMEKARYLRICIVLLCLMILIPMLVYGGIVRINWSPSVNSDIERYYVYYGTFSKLYEQCLDVGLANSIEIGDLNRGSTYYFAIAARDTAGNESIYYEELGIFIPENNSISSNNMKVSLNLEVGDGNESRETASAQPVDNGFCVIKQNPSMCGPTSMWMILNYYFKDDINGDDINCSIPIFKNDTKKDIILHAIIDCDNHVETDMGASWAALEGAVGGLYNFDRNQYFDLELEKHNIEYDLMRKNQLSYITDKYLNNNIPVILHLARRMPYSGHYVVLIGNKDGKVIYADPANGKIDEVDRNDFIEKRWYESPRRSYFPYYNAKWDGTSLAFWPKID